MVAKRMDLLLAFLAFAVVFAALVTFAVVYSRRIEQRLRDEQERAEQTERESDPADRWKPKDYRPPWERLTGDDIDSDKSLIEDPSPLE